MMEFFESVTVVIVICLGHGDWLKMLDAISPSVKVVMGDPQGVNTYRMSISKTQLWKIDFSWKLGPSFPRQEENLISLLHHL
jgi:hypothetical protein